LSIVRTLAPTWQSFASNAASAAAQSPRRPSRIAVVRPLRTSNDIAPPGAVTRASAVSIGVISPRYIAATWQSTRSKVPATQLGRPFSGPADEPDRPVTSAGSAESASCNLASSSPDVSMPATSCPALAGYSAWGSPPTAGAGHPRGRPAQLPAGTRRLPRPVPGWPNRCLAPARSSPVLPSRRLSVSRRLSPVRNRPPGTCVPPA